jgi:hypothetical protein
MNIFLIVIDDEDEVPYYCGYDDAYYGFTSSDNLDN